MSAARAPRLAALSIPDRRLVVVDCETNGLYGDVRILSLAVVELHNGIASNSKLWLLNPVNYRMDSRALDINGLTPELLAGAGPFEDHVDEVTEWLTAPDGIRLTLIGHKVSFDARQLLGEFTRLGLEFPPVDLLDTSRLAEEAQVHPDGGSLNALLAVLDLANSAPHTALGDTLATAEAALNLLRRIADRVGKSQLAATIDGLVVPFDPDAQLAVPQRTEPTIPLSDEHLAAHLTDLSDGRRRRAALDVCLAEDCPILATRMEDGIMTADHARQVIDWAFVHLDAGGLPRPVAGRLLRGVGQALRRAERPAFAAAIYRETLVPYLAAAGPCTSADCCARCETGAGVCDYVRVLRACVDAFIIGRADPFAKPKPARVEAFLPGYKPTTKRKRGRPPEGFYGELRRHGHLDAAGHGVARAAELRRIEGGRAWAYAILRKGWHDGCRTPKMVEMLASMTVVDGIDEHPVAGVSDPKAPVVAAIGYIDECLVAHAGEEGHIFTNLTKRRERLEALRDAPPRPERDLGKAVNRRQPHDTIIGRPPPLDAALAPR